MLSRFIVADQIRSGTVVEYHTVVKSKQLSEEFDTRNALILLLVIKRPSISSACTVIDWQLRANRSERRSPIHYLVTLSELRLETST